MRVATRSDTDPQPDYWQGYSNLQRTKHLLIREYLNGWFPKLGTWAGRVVYIDTHAGRGRHTTGDEGSPLVALKTFLSHSFRDKILEHSEVFFYFVERDEENATNLQQEIDALGDLPKNLRTQTAAGNCFELLQELVREVRADDNVLAPAFIFIDPYGFKVPGALLRNLMSFRHAELFITVIWRELDMALTQARTDPDGGLARTLDYVFDGRVWLNVDAPDFDGRADQTVNLFADIAEARWATHIRMLGDNQVTRYLLLHLTNHESGRDLMKDCIWKVCPYGGFYARKSHDPAQAVLITPEPNLDRSTWRVGEGPPRSRSAAMAKPPQRRSRRALAWPSSQSSCETAAKRRHNSRR